MGEMRFSPKIKLAVTVDDLFLWKGIPWPPGYSPSTVVPAMMVAFARHNLEHVYGFSATAPAGGEQAMREMFDQWSEAGHRIGNHTHYHANLNWVDEGRYIRDIERTAELIEPLDYRGTSQIFPIRDGQLGEYRGQNTMECRTISVTMDTRAPPISVWFYDTEFLAAHVRGVQSQRPGCDELAAPAIHQYGPEAVAPAGDDGPSNLRARPGLHMVDPRDASSGRLP